MKFTKMHGAGNDYVYINGFEEQVNDPAQLAQQVSDRHFGIGSDGLILILPSQVADLRMRMFNADGSEAEMCGNGIRCVAKYAYDHQLVDKLDILVETGNGILPLKMVAGTTGRVEKVQVNMGMPGLTRGDLPMVGSVAEQVVAIPIAIAGQQFEMTCVSMGNPHAVIYVDNVEQFPVAEIGAQIENHPWFPRRINVEFVQLVNAGEVIQRTWERGAGETLACGTGASAVAVAGVLTGRTERKILNHLRGGDLELEWLDNGPVMMTGPAVEVFSGDFIIQ
ncbi:MAG: diaminopimelate epimerase [Deltaproteobacteria bacterium]|jgi:diaminopimelate epimerase|nr:diaminopimelate epimerase [Deltaproteobacteria bacterium]MCW8893902.1 diaminopimelate epimerase [Deltaproteobacteria bacterium]MCW9049498.1 diaminopimelate epimerase [Deltaproteobacteria bacterium]